MKEKTHFVKGDEELLGFFRSHSKPYTFKLLGKEWIALPGVFSPKYSPDAQYFVRWMPRLRGKSFLEIGCGTGVVSVEAALRGAQKVIAIDLNKNAVKNTKLNTGKHRVNNKVNVRFGSLFGPIKSSEKFDFIFFNLPFGYRKKRIAKVLEKSVWDTNYQTQRKFLQEAHSHLALNGKLLIGFSTIGHVQELRKNARKFGWKIKERKSQTVQDLEGKHAFKLFELTPQ